MFGFLKGIFGLFKSTSCTLCILLGDDLNSKTVGDDTLAISSGSLNFGANFAEKFLVAEDKYCVFRRTSSPFLKSTTSRPLS